MSSNVGCIDKHMEVLWSSSTLLAADDRTRPSHLWTSSREIGVCAEGPGEDAASEQLSDVHVGEDGALWGLSRSMGISRVTTAKLEYSLLSARDRPENMWAYFSEREAVAVDVLLFLLLSFVNCRNYDMGCYYHDAMKLHEPSLTTLS